MVIKYLTIFLLSTSFKFNQPKKGAKIIPNSTFEFGPFQAEAQPCNPRAETSYTGTEYQIFQNHKIRH